MSSRPVGGHWRWRRCGVLFLTFLDNTVVSVALGDIQPDLHAGVSSLQWIVNGYALAFATVMLPAGAISDEFGRKLVMMSGIALFCADPSSVRWLPAARC